MKSVSVVLPAALLTAILPAAARAQGNPEQHMQAQQLQMKMQMQGQIEQIMRERPPQAETGALLFLRRINRIAELDSSDIESVEVVKGAAAQAYGPKASNGVVLITTKTGKGAGRVVWLPRGAFLAGSAAPLYVVDGMVVGEPQAQPEPAQVLTLDSLKRASVDVYWQEVAQLMVQGEMARNVSQRDNARGRAMEQMFGLEFDARGLQRAWRDANESERARIRTALEKVMTRHLDIEDQLMALEIADATRRLDAVRAEAAKRKEGRAERVRSAVDGILRDAQKP